LQEKIMSTSKRLDRLGLMGIASAIALTAAVGWSSTAWSADKNAQQWQQPQHSQSQGGQSGGQRQGNGGQQMQFKPQANNQQPQFQNRSGQQWNGHQQVNNQQQWQFKNQQRANNQPQFRNGNGQQWNSHQQVNNQQQWQYRNGQQWNGQPSRNGQFVPQNQWGNNNNNQWRNAQNGQSRNMQVRTTNVTTRYDWHNYQPGHRPADWNSRNHNVDFRAYQWNRTAQIRYHYRPYEPPHGYYYRRWAYGQIFPTIFWTQNYWLTDYYTFGLDNPPYGYVWVRYGPDALLVNVYDGQILSVEYNVFYA
jgi:hypothetical protein